MADRFDGVAGRLIGPLMARMNAAAEAEAVELLQPAPEAAVLVIGFGPGIGLARLDERLPKGRIVGVDPSAAMNRQAGRRLRRAIAAGRIILRQAPADQLTEADGPFDGAIAVHSLQLCRPLGPTAAALWRALRPGARLVTLTHDWAAAGPDRTVEAWTAEVTEGLAHAGFVDIAAGRGRAEKGRIVRITARRG